MKDVHKNPIRIFSLHIEERNDLNGDSWCYCEKWIWQSEDHSNKIILKDLKVDSLYRDEYGMKKENTDENFLSNYFLDLCRKSETWCADRTSIERRTNSTIMDFDWVVHGDSMTDIWSLNVVKTWEMNSCDQCFVRLFFSNRKAYYLMARSLWRWHEKWWEWIRISFRSMSLLETIG